MGRPDFYLLELIESTSIGSCRALEIGCGSGHHTILLAQHGFEVTGADVSDVALVKAEENASKANVTCALLLTDLMKHDTPGAPFSFIFDRGCWHLSDSAEVREPFAARVAANLEKDGLWFSIIGSADEPPRGPDPLAGPPRRSVLDIGRGMEPYFEILSIKASRFEANHASPPRAWARTGDCVASSLIPDPRDPILVQQEVLDRAAMASQECLEFLQKQVEGVRAERADHGVLRRVGSIVGVPKPPVVGGAVDKATLRWPLAYRSRW